MKTARLIKEGLSEFNNITPNELCLNAGILGLLAVPAYFEPQDSSHIISRSFVFGAFAAVCCAGKKNRNHKQNQALNQHRFNQFLQDEEIKWPPFD